MKLLVKHMHQGAHLDTTQLAVGPRHSKARSIPLNKPLAVSAHAEIEQHVDRKEFMVTQ